MDHVLLTQTKRGFEIMENSAKKGLMPERMDKDIVYSKAVKAGKRIYYLDVKKSRNDEMYVAITESKKIYSGEGENVQVAFEKHKNSLICCANACVDCKSKVFAIFFKFITR